jgi:hypothetical protein
MQTMAVIDGLARKVMRKAHRRQCSGWGNF